MIICPNCKEEIDDNSNYCDQCGHALVYCSNCSRVGMGRRCTYCGGLMASVNDNNNTRCVSISDNSYNNILSGIETTGSRLSISLSNVSELSTVSDVYYEIVFASPDAELNQPVRKLTVYLSID